MFPNAAVGGVYGTGPVVTGIIADGRRNGTLQHKCREWRDFRWEVVVGGTLATDGGNGKDEVPYSIFLSIPPHLPRNRHALGLIALSKSMIMAALGLPIPKLMMVIPSALADIMLASLPRMGTLNFSAKISTYLLKLVNRMYSPNPPGYALCNGAANWLRFLLLFS